MQSQGAESEVQQLGLKTKPLWDASSAEGGSMCNTTVLASDYGTLTLIGKDSIGKKGKTRVRIIQWHQVVNTDSWKVSPALGEAPQNSSIPVILKPKGMK